VVLPFWKLDNALSSTRTPVAAQPTIENETIMQPICQRDFIRLSPVAKLVQARFVSAQAAAATPIPNEN
jgi:hypothetical protein